MCGLSLVTVNWNGGDQLLRTLVSWQSALDESWATEVLLVDNASTDGSADQVAQNLTTIRIIRNATNIGFGAANNRAFEYAQGRYILLLNPDTIINRAALHTMLEFMRTHPRAGMCGPKILEADGKTISPWCARRELFPLDVFFEYTYLYRLFRRSRLFGRYTMGDWDHGADRQVASLSGACMLVRREALDQVGGFDERFFMYGEDIDWCRRFRVQDWQVWFVAGATIRHLGAHSTRQVHDHGATWSIRSNILFFRKWGRPLDVAKIRFVLSLGSIARALAWLCAGLVGPRELRHALGRSTNYLKNAFLSWTM